ncbi:hypothetical protein [Lentzea flava]|uniref:Uncharacterized protein n=1 Tax=Lentzea flava TaxID=103732 RepID=A0ABQ2UHL0_9PSEU|nr:hypothetical protein [Lentzea flava]MCP2198201.1 hypothetical protein [Lentzea flava]GGU30924.1 hypothetical protein GCM10010178_23910 [Lentzea flava]
MNESLHRPAALPEPVEHVIGEMQLTGRSTAGARARALAGLTLAVGAFTAITPTLAETTVSVV